MTAEFLSLVAGGVLSLLFSYIPGANSWFAGLQTTSKRLIMLAFLALTAGVVFGLSCTSWGAAWGIEIACDQGGAQKLVTAFVLALVANQATYGISPEAPAVRAAKIAAKAARG
jgi:hypothetical protein